MRISTRKRFGSMPGRNQRDFGSGGVLFVAAVLLMITVAAIPDLQHSLEAHRLNRAAFSVQSKLERARFAAIRQNGAVEVSIDIEQGWAKVQVPDPNASLGLPKGSHPGSLPEGVLFASTTPSRIVFDRDGRPTSPAVITLESSGSGRKTHLVVALSGRIRQRSKRADLATRAGNVRDWPSLGSSQDYSWLARDK